MAELDFTHHVSEVPAGQSLPEPVPQRERVQVSGIPDLQGSISNYADATNWMSTVGSEVATRASNAIAQKIGSELGKNPQGNVGVPLTDFDKTMTESYNTQAQSTLGLQAQKLITKSNIELASSPRINQQMIAASQQNITKGLDQIFSLAPSAIRPQMEAHFGSLMINQNEQLIERMTREQKAERIDKLSSSSKLDQENAYSLSFSGLDVDKNGDSKGAKSALNAAIAKANSARAIGDITEEQRQILIDTAYKSYLSGKYAGLAKIAYQQKKLPEFTKQLDENPPEDIPIKYRDAVYGNVLKSLQLQQQLQSRDQQLTMVEFKNRMVESDNLTGADLAEAQVNLTPFQAESLRTDFLNYQNKINKRNNQTANAIANFSKFETFPLESDESHYNALLELSKQKQQIAFSKGQNLSEQEAMMQTAATAAGPIKKFIDVQNSKASSGNPIHIQEVKATIDYMNKANASQNLDGITDETYAMISKFEALSSTKDPIESAQIAKEQVYNKKSDQNIANDMAWKQHLSVRKRKGQSDAMFALSQADIEPDTVVNVPLLSQYALNEYESLFKLYNGDEIEAKKRLREKISRTFGTTYVNGRKEYTMYPVEGAGNLPPNSTPFIHENLVNQTAQRLTGTKKLYDENKIDFYYEMNSRIDLETALASNRRIRELEPKYGSYKLNKIPGAKNPSHEVLLQQRELLSAKENVQDFLNGKPPKITQHFRDGHKEQYELIIQPNQSLGVNSIRGRVGSYDIKLKAGKSTQPLILADPESGPAVYKPNYDEINKNMMVLQYYLPVIIDMPAATKVKLDTLRREYIDPRL